MQNGGVMDEQSDEALVDAYRESGDPVTLDLLLTRHVGKVRNLIYPMVLNDADADDLTQEVMVKVFRSIGEFRKSAQFTSWLYRIAMNTTYSHLKRRQRNPVESHGDLPEDWHKTVESRSRLEQDEENTKVSEAMARLSAPLRMAVTLVCINQMTVADAARTAGCLAATMYWRVHEARRILRRQLASDGVMA